MNELEEILTQITQLESEITIKKNAIEKMQNDINFTRMESQKELNEVNRLQQCNQSMQAKIDMQKEIVEQENNKEILDSFMQELGGILR